MPVQAKIFTIPSSVSFVDSVAAGIIKKYGSDQILLSNITILLPGRRACRNLAEALLKANDGKPTILPQMRAIGDVEENEITFSSELSQEIPTAISSIKRRMILADMIMEWNFTDNKNSHMLDQAQAMHLAFELENFLDEIQKENLSFDNLKNIVPEELASHWQITLDFFDVIAQKWPAELRRLSLIDPVERRSLLIKRQIDLWKKNPPEYPVIAAGSTGSTPYTAELLAVICELEKGLVILPGLDKECDDSVWNEVNNNHPQNAMKNLLNKIGLSRHDVNYWQVPRDIGREKFVSSVMLPFSETSKWKDIKITSDDIKGIKLISARNQRIESEIIALMLRQVMENKSKTAAVITNDRTLAKRISSALGRWKVTIDDSAGRPLSAFPPVVFMKLVLEMIETDFAPVTMLAALKHPMASSAMQPAVYRKLVRTFEKNVLHGVYINRGIAGFIKNVENSDKNDKEYLVIWLQGLKEITKNLSFLYSRQQVSLRDILQAHIKCCEKLARTNESKEGIRLWSGDDGADAAEFIEEILSHIDKDKIIETSTYKSFFNSIWLGKTYRPSYGTQPRISILSPIEARLKHHDLFILAGVNEGIWPMDKSSPWMSKAMRKNFGFSEESTIGLSAHDFCEFLSATEVFITYSEEINGSPAFASPWLLRMKAVISSADLEAHLEPDLPWSNWAEDLHKPEKILAILRPKPVPPGFSRPMQLSVTQVEKLMRDPYAVYAKYVLDLSQIDELDREPDQSEFGMIVHSVLEKFVLNFSPLTYKENLEKLISYGFDYFKKLEHKPAIMASWWPRFEKIADWFVKTELKRRADIKDVLAEKRGRLELVLDNGSIFTITAQMDRIEINKSGDITIIDYKTGSLPKNKDVEAGYSPQLSLETIIVEEGDVSGLERGLVKDIQYWELSAENIKSPVKDIVRIKQEAKDGLTRLISVFCDKDTPYIASPDSDHEPIYNNYEHLERKKEWS